MNNANAIVHIFLSIHNERVELRKNLVILSAFFDTLRRIAKEEQHFELAKKKNVLFISTITKISLRKCKK